MEKFVRSGDFRPNEACPDYGKLQTGQQQNIKRIGKTRKGVQRYQCQTCKRTPRAQGGPSADAKEVSAQ